LFTKLTKNRFQQQSKKIPKDVPGKQRPQWIEWLAQSKHPQIPHSRDSSHQKLLLRTVGSHASSRDDDDDRALFYGDKKAQVSLVSGVSIIRVRRLQINEPFTSHRQRY
jgi:hypothetical protein